VLEPILIVLTVTPGQLGRRQVGAGGVRVLSSRVAAARCPAKSSSRPVDRTRKDVPTTISDSWRSEVRDRDGAGACS
jgi:hypothetical protein